MGTSPDVTPNLVQVANFLLKIHVFCRMLVRKTLKKTNLLFQVKGQVLAVILRYRFLESVQWAWTWALTYECADEGYLGLVFVIIRTRISLVNALIFKLLYLREYLELSPRKKTGYPYVSRTFSLCTFFRGWRCYKLSATQDRTHGRLYFLSTEHG